MRFQVPIEILDVTIVVGSHVVPKLVEERIGAAVVIRKANLIWRPGRKGPEEGSSSTGTIVVPIPDQMNQVGGMALALAVNEIEAAVGGVYQTRNDTLRSPHLPITPRTNQLREPKSGVDPAASVHRVRPRDPVVHECQDPGLVPAGGRYPVRVDHEHVDPVTVHRLRRNGSLGIQHGIRS